MLKQLDNVMGKLGVGGHKLGTMLFSLESISHFFDPDSLSGLVRGKWI